MALNLATLGPLDASASSPYQLPDATPALLRDLPPHWRRLGEDDRLDTILAHLRHKAPSVASEPSDLRSDQRPDDGGSMAGDGGSSAASYPSAKSELAKGLKEVKGRIKGLEDRIALKKKAMAAGAPGGRPLPPPHPQGRG